MKIHMTEDYESMSHKAAEIIAAQVVTKPGRSHALPRWAGARPEGGMSPL